MLKEVFTFVYKLVCTKVRAGRVSFPVQTPPHQCIAAAVFLQLIRTSLFLGYGTID